VDVDVVIDRSVEFIPDDASNSPRKHLPDAFPNEYFRLARSERSSSPVQLGKTPLRVEYEETLDDTIEYRVQAIPTAWILNPQMDPPA
jgi:hypothetical protein